jgi:polysaccharide export outer membrane protein
MRILLATAVWLSISGVMAAQAVPAASSFASNPSVPTTPTSPAMSGCSTTGARASEQTRFSERDPRYHLEPGDSFDLTFEFVPDFNQTVIVQPDGFVTLRGIGDTKVANKTVPELTSTLCDAYSKIMASPSLFIILKDFNKPYFTAGGQVAHPGKYDLRAETTLAEAIAVAGGFTEKSKHSQVLLFRRVSDQWTEAKVIDVKKMFGSKDLSEDPVLQPGDMIIVPQNRFSKVARFLPTPAVSAYMSPAQF